MPLALLILGIFLFICLVLVHEWGHYIAARKSGVDVEEFGIGFPPRAWAKKLKSGMDLSVNWIPAGGFVKLKGENDDDSRKGSFGAASLSAKVKIMTAGVLMNLVVAYLIFTFLALVGVPKLVDNQFTVTSNAKTIKQEVLVGYVEKDSPAEKAGLTERDQIKSVSSATESVPITHEEELRDVTSHFAGQNVTVDIVRDGQAQSVATTLRSSEEIDASKDSDNPKGYLGVSPVEFTVNRYTWSAPVVGAGLLGQITVLTLRGLGHVVAQLFTGHASQAGQQVTGPVGIVVLLKYFSHLGYQFILMVIAIISLTLAIMNILPIPALDGGRLFVTLLYRVSGRKLKKSTEDAIHGTGMVVLLILFALIMFVDIKRIL